MYGNVFAPSALAMGRQYVSPLGHGRKRMSRSSTAAASRTLRQYGEPSYSNTSMSFSGRGPRSEASVTFLPATRTMEYPSPSSSTRLGDQPLMSAPVPARSTSGIALETTRPSEPSATVNLRGVGATKPSGAEMETDAGSSIARQVVIRRGRAVVRPRRRTESAPVAAREAAMVVGCGGRCAAPRRSADNVETRRRFLVAESPPRKRPQAAVFASPAPVPGTRRARRETSGTALYRARTTPPHSSPKRTCASRPRRPIALFPPLGGCVRRGRLAEGRPREALLRPPALRARSLSRSPFFLFLRW